MFEIIRLGLQCGGDSNGGKYSRRDLEHTHTHTHTKVRAGGRRNPRLVSLEAALTSTAQICSPVFCPHVARFRVQLITPTTPSYIFLIGLGRGCLGSRKDAEVITYCYSVYIVSPLCTGNGRSGTSRSMFAPSPDQT